MSVLVTGGAGYIGSHMTLALLARGEEVVVVDDLRTGFDWAIPEGVTFARGDIGDVAFLDQVFSAHKPETVLHFAGSIVVPESVADPLRYYANNTVNSRLLIETAVRHEVTHFVFSSTAAVYGMPGDEPVRETADLRPISPYGRSKLMTEMMLEDTAHAHAIRYAALRYFNVAGADPQGRTGQSTKGATHLIKVACETALGLRDHLDIFGSDYPTPDGTAVRDYIHVSDLAAAHLDAIGYLRGGNPSIVCNVGYGRGFSVREVLETVRKVHGQDFDIRTAGRRAGDPAMIVADGSTARQKLGWTPKYDDLPTIVADALRWEDRLRFRNLR
ncbi:UDP-glucose 4-epimerase GalE [Aurantimonas sp. A2-1-M11]|uniref:UDP-glucose 4-epimerase GalE n=1 Tax=Aurantimonas sp. A2-1-M11 TaxID=3113712 RepID=UPI002F95CE18